ncbi:MAG: hypothetical protein AB4290_08845 [Spirulina sp.]
MIVNSGELGRIKLCFFPDAIARSASYPDIGFPIKCRIIDKR